MLAILSAALCWSGCGAQGPPKPPRAERPEPVKDLSANQVGPTIEIHFTLPKLATDGQRLTKPLDVHILRLAAPAGTTPSSSQKLDTWLALRPDEWSPFAQGETVLYAARLSDKEFHEWIGETLTVGVATATRGFRGRERVSDVSNLFSLPLVDVPQPPTEVTCQTTEQAIEVHWKPPTQVLSGKPVENLAGYRIYRKSSGKEGKFEFLGEANSPPFLDQNFEFGHTYSYKVRAELKEGGQVAESADSSVAEITPQDTFPPAAPANLTAIYAAGAVELIWTANTERDLAGYYVYRREGNASARRLTKELLRTPIFRDATVEPGHTYSYDVTAVDLTNNESQASEAVDVETR